MCEAEKQLCREAHYRPRKKWEKANRMQRERCTGVNKSTGLKKERVKQ